MHSFFATQVRQASLKLSPRVMRHIKKTALALPAIDEAGVEWSEKNYPNGYTSYGSLSQLHHHFSVFDELKNKLDQEVRKYTKALGLTFETGKLELSAIWVNVMPKDCYHAFHIHPLSVVSGTFYVSVPNGTSPLRIEDPRASRMMASPARKIRVDLKPKKGDVILFESWLNHEVPPHKSSEPRISVSFNYDWNNR